MPGGHKGTVDDLEVEVEVEVSREPTDGGVEAFIRRPRDAISTSDFCRWANGLNV
jgi:hypothetical protein